MSSRFASRMRCMKPSSIREMMKMIDRADIISFAGGLPAPELFPVDDIRVAAERVLRDCGPNALQYGVTDGIPALREQIATEMAYRGVDCSAGEVMITTGSQQGLDLLGKIFLDPGDVILTENPTYLAAVQAFQCFEADFRAVPMDEEGVIPAAVDALAAKHRVRFLYVIPNFQNPTGRTLSAARRAELVEIARRRDFIIVEDDPYGQLRYRGEAIPPLKSFDSPDEDDARVIYMSTFSKIIAPGFRTGWLLAPQAIRDKLIIAKQASDLHTSSFDQLVLARYLRDFDNHRHVEKIRSAYRERYLAMDAMLSEVMPTGFRWTRPDGGMFLWVDGPDEFDASAALPQAIEHGVAFVPGCDFFPGAGGRNHMRLNFSNADVVSIRDGIGRLGAICAEMVVH